MKIIYCVDDVLAAAKYIAKHNHRLDMDEHEIYDLIMKYVGRGKNTGTAGFHIRFGYISDDTFECSVTVTPSFEDDCVHATLEV